jgi:hypothetical protein
MSVYGWLFRHLPGPTPVKVALAVLLVGVVATVLLLVVFPWVEPHLPINRVVVDG